MKAGEYQRNKDTKEPDGIPWKKGI